MAHCLNCNRSFTGTHCPSCGGPPAPTHAQINEALKPYTLVALAGFFGIILVTQRYPLLDQDRALFLALFLVFVPILVYIFLSVRKRAGAQLEFLKKLFVWFASLLATLVLLLLINGAFDNRPVSTENSVVIRKSVAHGRGGPNYTIRVSPSWRPGKDEEKLPVTGSTYGSLQIGQPVDVEVHPGAFGLPWFSSVTPRYNQR